MAFLISAICPECLAVSRRSLCSEKGLYIQGLANFTAAHTITKCHTMNSAKIPSPPFVLETPFCTPCTLTKTTTLWIARDPHAKHSQALYVSLATQLGNTTKMHVAR